MTKSRLVYCVLASATLLCACDRTTRGGATPVDTTAVGNPALRDELLRMGSLDQTARAGMDVQSMADTIMARASLAIDSVLTRRLDSIVEEHGWPTWTMVGKEAASHAFRIVQHSPSDAFQRRMLALIESAASAGEATPSDVAMLTDRLRTHDGLPQLYGTQFRIVDGELVPFPIENPEGLDQRRAAVGLVPMTEYVKLLEDLYKGPVKWPPDST